MQSHGTGQQLHPSQSGSTPHDRVTIPQMCPSRSLPLHRPRQSALRYPAVVANRSPIHSVQRGPPLIHEPLPLRPTRSIGSTPITHLIRGTQIPIAHAAPSTYPLPRFPPLEVCGRRPRARGTTVMGPASENLHIRYRGDPVASPALSAVTPKAEVNSNSRQTEFGCALKSPRPN